MVNLELSLFDVELLNGINILWWFYIDNCFWILWFDCFMSVDLYVKDWCGVYLKLIVEFYNCKSWILIIS